MDDSILKLKNMYYAKSKHSNYQILSKKLKEKIGNIDADIKFTYENERLEYILKNLNIKNKTVLDIGGNSGFFTLEMIDNGVNSVHYYEGNETHSEFVKLASKVLNLENKIEVTNRYFLFNELDKFKKNKYDITLLLNVLHHVGDDYGDVELSKEKAKESIIEQINSLSTITRILIFQLGFNWKGTRSMCLFENGTKKELIDFIAEGTNDNWQITQIGIAQLSKQEIKYYDLNNNNICRNDELGEFLNRPIFIMQSRRYL
ncbi:class I SAM-dependent methyltransferase [Clostridium sp. MB05]|uniref:class I SAM-dependent methyltransferase n=1 Tax=Clostridium sp. MB05 TaxID=3376682 RepID=UPI0039820F4C